MWLHCATAVHYIQVVLCSAHYAILNPVAEALLSLLFPFVWQGAYIPVMPSAMTDMLEGQSLVIAALSVCDLRSSFTIYIEGCMLQC
jgi:DENN (AEX-3) domain